MYSQFPGCNKRERTEEAENKKQKQKTNVLEKGGCSLKKKAPSAESVAQWRERQKQRLYQRVIGTMSNAQVDKKAWVDDEDDEEFEVFY